MSASPRSSGALSNGMSFSSTSFVIAGQLGMELKLDNDKNNHSKNNNDNYHNNNNDSSNNNDSKNNKNNYNDNNNNNDSSNNNDSDEGQLQW